MKLWGRQTSFNVQKVCWLLGELRLEFEHEQLGGRFGGLDTADFGHLNPHRKVPVLQDGDLTLWESHSILRYLAAAYGGEAWWPASAAARSHVDRWLDWHATRLQPSFMALFWGYYRQPQATRNWRAISTARAACKESYQLLDDQLASSAFLCGDNPSLADIAVGATLFRYFGMGLPVPHPPNIEAWYGRLQARQAYQQHIMTSFRELHARATF